MRQRLAREKTIKENKLGGIVPRGSEAMRESNLRRWAREKAMEERKPKGWTRKLVSVGRGRIIDLEKRRKVAKDRARRAEREARIRARIQQRTELQRTTQRPKEKVRNRGIYGDYTRCPSCDRRMKRHAWRQQCKNCDPVKTVD